MFSLTVFFWCLIQKALPLKWKYAACCNSSIFYAVGFWPTSDN